MFKLQLLLACVLVVASVTGGYYASKYREEQFAKKIACETWLVMHHDHAVEQVQTAKNFTNEIPDTYTVEDYKTTVVEGIAYDWITIKDHNTQKLYVIVSKPNIMSVDDFVVMEK